jgi:hypothetical protein
MMLASCSKSKVEGTTPNPVPSGVSAAGYGSSTQPFSSNSWKLPTGVQLEDSIHDYSYCWAFPPFTQVQPKDWKGVPVGFTFCFTIKNNTGGPVIVQFPPQLDLVCSSVLYQNVLIIELGSVEMSAGATKTVVAQAFCINKGRHAPQTFNEENGNFLSYAFGPSEIPSPLQEVVDIVRSKHITMTDVLKADGTIDGDKATKYSVIQKAIWEVTDEGGLTVETRNKLQAL